jgi:TonB-linked SusC/RagA family outer membrane protein
MKTPPALIEKDIAAATGFRNLVLPSVRITLGLIVLLIVAEAPAQNLMVTGRVTSQEDGGGMPGVNVVVNGTNMGTATDIDGKFSLSVGADAILTFSFVGFSAQQVGVASRAVIDVTMLPNVNQLSEVVITALGFKTFRDKVGSASTPISAPAIVRSGEPTLINGMSGKSSGLIVSKSAGDPGSGSYIQIRGQSSITNSVQPLIIVDGIPVSNTSFSAQAGIVEQSRLNDINPADIESMEILKGASASALWGTRAGNGVIMITTKRGSSKADKVNISYSGTYSSDAILTKHPLQTTYGQGTKGYYKTNVLNNNNNGFNFSFGDKIAKRPGGPDDVYTNQGFFKTSDARIIYPIKEPNAADPTASVNGGKNSTQTFDPYDAVFGTGHYYDQTLTISGGNRESNYYFSVNNLNQKGIVREGSTYGRTSLRVNTERQLNDWLRFTSALTYSRVNQEGVQNGNNINTIMVGALRTPPDWDNGQGYQGTYYPPSGAGVPNRQLAYRNQIGMRPSPVYENPVWSMNNTRTTDETDRFIGSLQFEVDPVSWLKMTIRGGLDHYSNYRVYNWLPGGSFKDGLLDVSTARETQFNFDGFAQSRFRLGSGITAGALLGFNANQRIMDLVGGQVQNFTISSNPPLSLDNTTSDYDNPYNGFSRVRSAAFYGTADLEYKQQLFLALTGRAENSSVFNHSNNPTFFYPSATLNWHVLKTVGGVWRGLTFSKIRIGYGVVSTVPQPYNTKTYWDPAFYSDDGFNSLIAGTDPYSAGFQRSAVQGNQALKPETKKELEGGIDLRFANNRLSFSATYFTNTISDVIIPASVPGSIGYTSKTANVGEIKNKGVEFDFSGDILRKGPFSLNMYGNWTHIINKVTGLGQATVVTFNNALNVTGEGAVVVGYPVAVHYGTSYARTSDGELALDVHGFPQLSPTASVAGDPNPEWRMGLGTVLTWKMLSLNVLFEHSHGGQMWGGTRQAMIGFGTHKDTDREVHLTAAEATTLKNYAGQTAKSYGYKPNADGSYTVRGYKYSFGADTVLVDEEWWRAQFGQGSLGGLAEPYMESAQWTKLREVSLTYSLSNEEFRSRTKLSSIDFVVTGRNLILWTDFQGNDPETNLRGVSNVRGRDYFNNPATRSFLFTIRINY